MIELGDGSIKVEATDRISEARLKQVLRDPSDWVNNLSVSETVQQPPEQTGVAAADMRDAVDFIDGARGVTQTISIQGAFEAWSQLRQQYESGAPVALDDLRSAAEVLSQLIGRANESHAKSTFVEVKTGITGAFFS